MTRGFCHKYQRRIAFAQTDAAGVAHFSALLDLVEEAEHDFLAGLCVSVFSPESGWPRVALRANFNAPARFHDLIEVRLRPKKLGRSSITWGFEIHRAGEQTLIANGEMTVCHVLRVSKKGVAEEVFGGREWVPAPLPKELAEYLRGKSQALAWPKTDTRSKRRKAGPVDEE